MAAKRSRTEQKDVLAELVSEVVRVGGDALEVEYDDGYEEVMAFKGHTGIGIARLPTSDPEAKALHEQLREVVRRKRRMQVGGSEYELRGRQYDSFGEAAFRIEVRRAT